MAAFPPPTLDLIVPDPLRDLFRSCEVGWINSWRSADLNAFERDVLRPWLEQDFDQSSVALRQFETLLDETEAHRGPIAVKNVGALFNRCWQTPHDCLTYFTDWRETISEAIRVMDDPPFFSSSWFTETVVALRNAILAEKAFDRLPILADALEEAGCDNRYILDHLRSNEDHTHMCWVLDILSTGVEPQCR